MPDFTGKKILMLGAYPWMELAIEKAHEMGATVAVTDWIKDAPAKHLADESYDISTMDPDALEGLAREIKADAVFLGVTDNNLIPGYELCRRLGLPCYANSDQFSETLNKDRFKELALRNGVLVARSCDSGSFEEADLRGPFIVKPVDSYSSKGISVCFDEKDLPQAIDYARDVSATNKVIIEEYLEGDDIYAYFTVQDGKVSLSALADRLMFLGNVEKSHAPLPQLYWFPSKYVDLYYDQAHDAVQRMIDDLGIEQGSFMLQGFVIDGRVVFFEMGLRPTGGAGFILIRAENEIDQLEMHLRYSLGQDFGPWDIAEYDNPRFEKPACVLVPLLSEGTISCIKGMDVVMDSPYLVRVLQLREEGDVLDGGSTLNQALSRIYLMADTKEQLREEILRITRALDVVGEDGSSMLVPWFTEDDLDKHIGH